LIKAKTGKYFYSLRCESTIGKVLVDPIANMAASQGSIYDSAQRDLAYEIRTFPNHKRIGASVASFTIEGAHH
jgi:hypothetical protein